LQRSSREKAGDESAARGGKPKAARRMGCGLLALIAAALLLAALPAWAGPPGSTDSELPLPDAPQPQTPARAAAPEAAPCPAASAAQPATSTGTPPAAGGSPQAPGDQPGAQRAAGSQSAPCPPQPPKNWFERFLTGPEVKPMTPKEKAHLAARNVIDPFNGLTILGGSAITVGSDADSAYGPGMKGFARNVGVSYTQDMTGEFFGTFLIPSIVHQDPHYHRMPNASIPRRAGHAIAQVVWAQGDDGQGMVNYAGLAGSAIGAEISDLYVPGEKTNPRSTAERYSIGLGTAPLDNFITEFMPDVARHIHFRVVLFQWIINQVAGINGTARP